MHGTTQKHTHTHTHAPMVCMVTSITPLRKVKRTIKKFKKSPDKEPLKKASVVLNQWHGQIVWFSLVPWLVVTLHVSHHRCGTTQMCHTTDVAQHRCVTPQMWHTTDVAHHRYVTPQTWHTTDVAHHKPLTHLSVTFFVCVCRGRDIDESSVMITNHATK